jgi:hypothetical protein
MGADVWYADLPDLRGYVAWIESTQRISISLRPGTARPVQYLVAGCAGYACAYKTQDMTETTCIECDSVLTAPEREEGAAGLLALADLVSAGWGGRHEVIGSPRGVAMTYEDAVRVAELLAARIDEVTVG